MIIKNPFAGLWVDMGRFRDFAHVANLGDIVRYTLEGVRFFHTIRHFEMWMDGDGYGRFEWDVALGKDDRITMTFDYHPDKPEAEDHHEA